jgi:hypothetical protein
LERNAGFWHNNNIKAVEITTGANNDPTRVMNVQSNSTLASNRLEGEHSELIYINTAASEYTDEAWRDA